MAAYFKDIWIGVTTIIAGMAVTLRHMIFERAITIQYPREIKEMFPRARAKLFNTIDDCECCYKCQRICPIDVIFMKGLRAGKDEDLGLLPDGKPKQMHIIQFEIDFLKCLYCGLCVDVCPQDSLHWEAPQEASTVTREELYIDFTNISEEEKQALITKDEERKKAKAAMKKKPGAKPGVKPAARSVVDKPNKDDKPTIA